MGKYIKYCLAAGMYIFIGSLMFIGAVIIIAVAVDGLNIIQLAWIVPITEDFLKVMVRIFLIFSLFIAISFVIASVVFLVVIVTRVLIRVLKREDNIFLKDAENHMQERLQTKIKVTPHEIKIKFSNHDDLNRILNQLDLPDESMDV